MIFIVFKVLFYKTMFVVYKHCIVYCICSIVYSIYGMYKKGTNLLVKCQENVMLTMLSIEAI